MVKRRGLPTSIKSRHENHFVEEISKMTRTKIIRNIPIDKINANIMQPRKDFGELKELADSIKEKGIIEPILVRPINGRFEIIAGERRYRAAKLVNLKEGARIIDYGCAHGHFTNFLARMYPQFEFFASFRLTGRITSAQSGYQYH